MTKPRRKETAVLGWFPTTPATEQAVLDMASGRQIALRTRLRHHYWLTDCRPLTELTVQMQRRKMALIDPKEAMEEAEVQELLSDHYGFSMTESVDGGRAWHIPELAEARGIAVDSIAQQRQQASQAGQASAVARAAKQESERAAQSATRVTSKDSADF